VGPTKKLAHFVAETSLDDIPSHVVMEAKNLIINVLGAILAGSAEKTGKIGIDLVRWAGGEPQSTVIGGGFKTSSIMASLANGISAHATDQDDNDVRIGATHPTVTILPAVLALGEYGHASGKQILEAYILGVEAEDRVGLGVTPAHLAKGFHGTGVLGHVGATIGCCKLLHFEAKDTETALGIVGSLASGIRHNVGSMSKPLSAGNAAENGIIAATLAQRGFTSVEDVLEGTLGGALGFVHTFGGDEAKPEYIAKDLGRPYVIESPGIAIKGNPCGTYASALVETLQAMVKEYSFSADQVESIELGTNPQLPNLMRYVYPKDSLEAKYSVPFVVAVTLVDGGATLKQFTNEKVQDLKVKELISKVKVYIHPDLADRIDRTKLSATQMARAYITIRLISGEEYSRWTESAKGYVDKPLTEREFFERYYSFASLVLSSHSIKETFEMVRSLEKIRDIGELMFLLRGD